jgi:diguanylate cyclase (GGDEF)-like protein
MSRASTMLLALLILNVLLGAVCLVVARGERRSLALELWGWGLLIYAIGILTTLPTVIPFALRKIAGNSLIAFAPVLTIAGALSLTRHRLNRRWVTAGLIASILPIILNHVGPHYEVLVDILAPAPIANILFIYAAVVLVYDPPSDARSGARFLAGTFIFSVLIWTMRMVAIWTSIGATNDRDRADLTIALFSIAQIVAAVAATLGVLWMEVRNMQAALQRLANDDVLTGLPNRRATVERFVKEAARAAHNHGELAMVLFDVDHFKQVNDTHGHLVGDAALRHVAAMLRAAGVDGQLVGRIGGEEFVVVLGEKHARNAAEAANRLRETIAAARLTLDDVELSVTVSGGIAMYPADGTDWDQIFGAADRRLYAAKSGGRNRVEAPSVPQLVAV